MVAGPRIALIHATPVAMDPVRNAFEKDWPEAECVNILEDSLSTDRLKNEDISEDLSERIVKLAGYAREIGSRGILFTCSAFGEAIEAASNMLDVPVLKPNEAMFDAAMERGGRIGMIYTFQPSRAGMEAEFHDQAERNGTPATLESVWASGAIEAAKAGDFATHNRLVAEGALKLRHVDAIMLAHFSTSQAAPAVKAVTNVPILTSPNAAVMKLKRLLV
jgi:hypothetical protein